MEISYIWPEQMGEFQASYDAFVLVKIAHDAGADVISTPIDYSCDNFGDQCSVFSECLQRIFPHTQVVQEGENEYGESEIF